MMFKPTAILPGKEIENPEEDLRTALRVEQYRLGKQALFLPSGLRWNYLPLAAIRQAEEAHRSVTAGKCVAVTERRPTLVLKTEAETFTLNLERQESLQKIVAALREAGAAV